MAIKISFKKILNFLENKAPFLILAWIIILSILYSLLSILRHNHFQSGGFDLGIFDQAVWQYSQFTSPFNTIKGGNILGDHLTLTLPLLSPLFYLWNDVRMLLIFQAFWISLSAFPIYKLCRHRGFSSLTSFNLSFVYSLFYGIQFAIFFDFHPIVIGVGLISWFVYFLETKRMRLTIATLVLVLLTQENMGIAISSLGFIYFFKKEFRKVSIFFIFGGLIVSFLATKAVAFFSLTGYQYTPQLTLNPINLAIQLFNSEEKRQVFIFSLSWFSFLPLLSPGSMLALLTDLSQYFITGNNFARMWSPFMHHRAILSPFLLLGTLEALAFLKRKISPLTVSIFLVFVSLGLQFIFHFPLNKLAKIDYWKNESWMSDNYSLFKFIPKDASLAAQQSLVPHLSHRKEIYLAWPKMLDNNKCGQKSCWWLEFGGKPYYLVVDRHKNQWITQLLETQVNFESAVNNMEKAGSISLIKDVNQAKLYKINY